MTERVGSDGEGNWTSETFTSTDHNDTIGAKGLKIIASTVDATEYTRVNQGEITIKTYTFTPINRYTVIIGYLLESELKTAPGGGSNVSITSTSGAGGTTGIGTISSMAATNTTDTYLSRKLYMGGTATDSADDYNKGVILGQTSYTITIKLLQGGSTDTAYARNLKLTIYCIEYGNTTETDSAKITS